MKIRHIVYFNYSVFLCNVLLLTLTLTAADETECVGISSVYDTDQVHFLQDYGPDGIRGTVNVTIANRLQPGAVISVVTKSVVRGSVNLIADDIYIIHIDARIEKKEFIINTSKRLNLEWREDEVRLSNPVLKNAKTTTTLIYEAEGFRIFINGREITFYTHRTDKPPRVIALYHDYVYKVMYMTTRETGKPLF